MTPRPLSVRLDRLLANMGYGSRREIAALAAAGQVVLDGVPIRKGDAKVQVARDLPARMTVRGAPLDPPPGLALVMHKPLGVTCSHKEVGALVYDLLPQRWKAREPAISTVGRLDKDTSGLLLLTDDGDLLHRIISPRANVAKRYLVTLARPMEGSEGATFAAGTLLLEGEDKPLAPAELEVLSPTTAHLTIHEGRYHQVRRMFAAVGNHVEALHRDRVGGLDLPDDLAPGAFRMLDDAGVAAIFTPR
ncbi:MAG: pseudouridine synthase [Caulobacteraceae bacterium]|nr:MAG: pseudouridine synthase [Caulobacteraceae bacterium]